MKRSARSSRPFLCGLEIEITLGVVVADIRGDLLELCHICGIFAVLDPLAKQVAEDSSEIFVSCVGNEAAAVGQHADEARDHSEICKRSHLALHTVSLIVEPPARSELYLAGDAAALEVSEHRSEHVVVLGVERVENSLGEHILFVKTVEDLGKSFGDLEIVDRVKARVGAELLEHSRVVVTQSTDMELPYPAALCILLAEIDQLLDRLVVHGVDSVVGKTASVLVEEVEALGEVGVDSRKIGAERGNYLGVKSLDALDSSVIFKRVVGSIGCADGLYVALFDESLNSVFVGCKKRVDPVPDILCGLLAKRFIDVKISLELKVSPMIKGITDKQRNGLCKREPLFVVVGIARDPGQRTKIAVKSTDPRVDPVGACVGVRGSRVRNITEELEDERIDIIPYDEDIKKYAANALLPARIEEVKVDAKDKALTIMVSPEQSKIAFGRKAQNVRLAAKLLDYKVTIVSTEGSAEQSLKNKIRQAAEELAEELSIALEDAETLVANGFVTIDGLKAAETETLLDIPGIDAGVIADIIAKLGK